ncbi:Sterol 3-beta-glucosyltransferase [Mortierella sp. GBA30]|nr:Sterol 3-beta-glucosyltransferase [Mortierella sp. GBA30]
MPKWIKIASSWLSDLEKPTWTSGLSIELVSKKNDVIATSDLEQEAFRKEFSFPDGEALAEIARGYLLRILPLYGKIYLSDNYICFKSTVYGSSTRAIVPLSEVDQADEHRGTGYYFHGLYIISRKTDKEVFFEFSNRDARNAILTALRDRITPDVQERHRRHRAKQIAMESPLAELDNPTESRVLDLLHKRLEVQEGTEPMSLASHPCLNPSRPLHVTCLTIGSRGDVQPYIAFCKRLMEDGRSCRIATRGEYKDWIKSHSIKFGYAGQKLSGYHISEPFPFHGPGLEHSRPFAVAEHNLGRGYNYMSYTMIEQVLWRDNSDLDWKPLYGLEEFLEVDLENKPVYIGFGSMVVSDPETMTRTIIDAVVKAGIRAIISKGWSDELSTQDDGDGTIAMSQRDDGEEGKVYSKSVYMIQSVPHDWLFYRLAGVVHHGGAGTTAAGLRAGVSTVLKPYFGDRYFWAQRVEDAGVGVWCRDLTVKKLAAALTAITMDENRIRKAQLMGERIRAEDGVETAIHYFYHDLSIAKQRLERNKIGRKEKAIGDRDKKNGDHNKPNE